MSKMYIPVLFDENDEVVNFDVMLAKSDEAEVRAEVEMLNEQIETKPGDYFGVGEIEFFPKGK